MLGGVHLWLRLPDQVLRRGRRDCRRIPAAGGQPRPGLLPRRAARPVPGLSCAGEEPPALVRGVEIIAEILRAS